MVHRNRDEVLQGSDGTTSKKHQIVRHNSGSVRREERIRYNTSVFTGLEQHLSEITYKVIIDRRRASWNAVRTEERRQISLGIYDPHEMMKVVRVESEHSEKRARIVGLLHADKR